MRFYGSLVLIAVVMMAGTLWGASDPLAQIQTQKMIKQRVTKCQPKTMPFIKDKPIFCWTITTKKFSDLPEVIRKTLGSVDSTTYTEEYLQENIGSVVALQMNGDAPDFYVIDKKTFKGKYRVVALEFVGKKNEKLVKSLETVPDMKKLLQSGDKRLIAALKTSPVAMIRMSDIGYPLEKEIMIQSPWGGQTKPGGQEGYLVWDDGQKQYYMCNVDAKGFPIGYIPVGKLLPAS